MQLQSILIEQIKNDHRLLVEDVCRDLLPEQRRIIEGINRELLPLIEASLTADQIKSLFGEIEKQSVAGGQSRTVVGAGVDVAKKANEVINNVGKWLANTTPVKMADEKFEQLKGKIGAKFPDLDKQLTGFGTWMKENPGKSAAIIGVLTAVASLAGGPVGGAIAGQVLRGAAELIKGEKLSTAVGKGIKTAALGFITGKAFEVLGKVFSGMRLDSLPIPGAKEAGLEEVSFKAARTLRGWGSELKQTVQGFDVAVFPQEAEAIKAAVAAIQRGEMGAFDTLRTIAKEVNSASYQSAMTDIIAGARMDQIANDSLLQWINGTAQAAQAIGQGAVAASTGTDNKDKKESYYTQQRPLSEGQVYLLFKKIDQQQDIIMEGPIWDKVKGAAKAGLQRNIDDFKTVAGAVGKGASWVGKQATEKITSAKLLASWKLEGSPTDPEKLADFLRGQGVDDSIIDQSYASMSLPKPGTAVDKEAEPEAEKDAEEKGKEGEKAPLGTYGYDEFAGMAFTSSEDRAEYYQIIGKKDPGLPKKPKLNSGAEPWDAEKFKKEQMPYIQASDMVLKLPIDRQARLLKQLLKGAEPAAAAAPAKA